MTVVIFNVHSRRVIPGESTAKTVTSQRIGIQVESEKKMFFFGFVDSDNGFQNMIKRTLFLVVFELFYCHYSAISLQALL